MINTVREFLDKYNIKNTTVIIAFSAGPDSCALARIVNNLKSEYNLKIVLAYFNHMWRKEAILEEEFTIKFADTLNIEYFIEKAPKDVRHSEEVARDLRYNFLCDTAKKYCSDYVFLAHNKNDNIETFVYRLIKGTSIKGLCSIPEKRDIFYRPLLKIEKEEILKFLNNLNQSYMIDESNFNSKYKRNFIRNEILPLFKKINPNYLNNIDNLITTSNFMSKIVIDTISDIMDKIIKDNIINRDEYIALNVEYRYELLNLYLGDKLKYRDFKTIKKLDDFILSNLHSKTSLNKNEFLRTRKNKIFIEYKKEKENESAKSFN